jgi:lipopolysaccharide export system protein LptA
MIRPLLLLFICFIIFTPSHVRAQVGLGGISQDSNKPIDIVSDKLTVNSKDNIANFVGDVEATQGGLMLKSDRMKVYYNGGVEGGTETESSLSKIVTKGNTYLSVPDKKASAHSGVYDVDKGLIVLQGNVLLKRGASQLRGDTFWYDVKSGKSRVSSKGDGSRVKGKSKTGKSGRVKGVFVPRKKQDSK